MSLVPAHLPIRVGAALCGHSEPTFRRRALPLVRAEDGCVSRDALEALLTREITTDDYVRALNALAPRRARERRYKATGRAA